MFNYIAINLCLLSCSAGPDVDAVRFGQLIEALHAPVRDVTLACEGGLRAGEGARAAALQVDGVLSDFQCRYCYRCDGAALLDLYQRRLKEDDRQSHTLLQNLGGTTSLAAVPDLKRLALRPAPKRPKAAPPARPSPLDRPGCPDRILYLWYFQGLSDPRGMHYEFQGWEEVDGHRCLRVELDLQAVARPEYRSRMRFWIDLDRGGHPLKVERFRRGQLDQRCEHIELQQFKDAKGTSIWLPVSGETESFDWVTSKEKRHEMVHYQEPVLVESCRVITGSVVLNRGLSDADLSVTSSAKKYGEFAGFKADPRQRERPAHIDPVEVQKRLDETLADADGKASRLEASAPERNNWDLSTILSRGLPMLGAVLLCLAGFRRWRGR